MPKRRKFCYPYKKILRLKGIDIFNYTMLFELCNFGCGVRAIFGVIFFAAGITFSSSIWVAVFFQVCRSCAVGVFFKKRKGCRAGTVTIYLFYANANSGRQQCGHPNPNEYIFCPANHLYKIYLTTQTAIKSNCCANSSQKVTDTR